MRLTMDSLDDENNNTFLVLKEEERGFSPEALQAKYREERDKRLRNDGYDQYRTIEETSLQRYAKDLWSNPLTRDAIEEEVECLIVGAGYSGMILAVRLLEAGIRDIRIVDKAGDFGGTWYWNQYPGVACDIESYIYMPLLEETGYMPTEKYARGPEILEHSQRIGKLFGLYPKALFQTEVETLDWNTTSNRWDVVTDRGDRIHARFVTTAGGVLHKPKFPGLDGIDTFKGHGFHTSRWDYEYTGGSQHGHLHKLHDKRIGIIGTGATGIQVIPHLAESAKHLFVFQRTPSSVDVRLDRPTEPNWVAGLKEGWQQRRMDNFNLIVSGNSVDEDEVADGWTDILTRLLLSGKKMATIKNAEDPDKAAQQIRDAMQLADYEKMEQVRARVDSMVRDPTVANSLKPWYNQMCKRPCFHNDYLATFNRSNVTLVDTRGKGIEYITEKGIVANGTEHELDCIIYASGFETLGADYSSRMRITMRGRDGITLDEYWKDGSRTLHGLYTRHFPNHFIMSPIQSALTPNFTHMINEQAKHITFVIAEATKRGASTVEASEQSEEEWVRTIVDMSKLRDDFSRECTPGYYNNEGKITEKILKAGRYGLGSPAFIELLKNWREEGSFVGLEFDGRPLKSGSDSEGGRTN